VRSEALLRSSRRHEPLSLNTKKDCCITGKRTVTQYSVIQKGNQKEPNQAIKAASKKRENKKEKKPTVTIKTYKDAG